MRERLNQQGMTLVELLVGIAMMLIVISGVTTLLTNVINHGSQGKIAADMQQDARWAVDMIAREVRYAQNTPVTPTSGQLNFTNMVGDNITYALGETDSSIYSQTLYRRVKNGTANPVTEQTTRGSIQDPTKDILFTVSGQAVTISLTLTRGIGTQILKETATTTVTVAQRARNPISLP